MYTERVCMCEHQEEVFMCASCIRLEKASVPCRGGCVQVAHRVLLAGLHGSEGVNMRHCVPMCGRSELCVHQQAYVCEVWACANMSV